MVKMIGNSVNHLFVYIIILPLQQGFFLKELKIANVLPLFKANDPPVFNNYHPVSLLCVLSKFHEKVMYNSLIRSLEYFNIRLQNKFGFRKLHSFYMALMVLTDKLIETLENGEFVTGVY